MDDVLRVHVLHDVSQAVDDELALVALQRAAFEEVVQRALAVLKDDAVRLAVGVLRGGYRRGRRARGGYRRGRRAGRVDKRQEDKRTRRHGRGE